MRSWKTTLAGLFTVLAGVGNCYLQWYNGQPVSIEAALPIILTGIGLMCAKDHNVSGTVSEKQKPE